MCYLGRKFQMEMGFYKGINPRVHQLKVVTKEREVSLDYVKDRYIW